MSTVRGCITLDKSKYLVDTTLIYGPFAESKLLQAGGKEIFVTSINKAVSTGRQQARFIDVFYHIQVIKHPSLFRYKSFSFTDFQGECKPSIVSQYVEAEPLEKKWQQMDPSVASMCAWQVADALHCLHSAFVTHGHLCKKTIMIDNDNQVFLKNYGLSEIVSELFNDRCLLDKFWCAPELLENNEVEQTIHTDVWAFGVLLFELFGKKKLSDAVDNDIQKIINGKMPSLTHIHTEIAAIIAGCWAIVPKKRLTIANVMEMLPNALPLRDVVKKCSVEHFLRTKTEAGDRKAAMKLASCLCNGKHGVKENQKEGANIYKKLANAGLPEAQHAYGYCLQQGIGTKKDMSGGFEYIKKAAENNDIHGMVDLGVCYLKEDGVKEDEELGLAYLRKAADLGDPKAQMEYSDHIYKVNLSECMKYLKMSVDQNHCDAIYTLGWYYIDGKQLPQNFAKAAELFKKAADMGLVLGCYEYGKLLMDGKGIDKDPLMAYAYLSKAFDGKMELSDEDIIDDLRFRLTGLRKQLRITATQCQSSDEADTPPQTKPVDEVQNKPPDEFTEAVDMGMCDFYTSQYSQYFIDPESIFSEAEKVAEQNGDKTQKMFVKIAKSCIGVRTMSDKRVICKKLEKISRKLELDAIKILLGYVYSYSDTDLAKKYFDEVPNYIPGVPFFIKFLIDHCSSHNSLKYIIKEKKKPCKERVRTASKTSVYGKIYGILCYLHGCIYRSRGKESKAMVRFKKGLRYCDEWCAGEVAHYYMHANPEKPLEKIRKPMEILVEKSDTRAIKYYSGRLIQQDDLADRKRGEQLARDYIHIARKEENSHQIPGGECVH